MVVDGMAAQSDEVGFHDDVDDAETQRLREKAERKRARKDAKRAAKGLGASADAGEVVEEDDQPFDYAAASSILNPPRESKDQMRARKKKEVNPYAKSMDAPKGLPRAQRERSGRSMTYK